jgi:NAD(P)-dependent dehydrogenase (short-subunit alcohol dehydrogenase family)
MHSCAYRSIRTKGTEALWEHGRQRGSARALGPEIFVNNVAPGTIQFPGEVPDEDYIRRVPLHKVGTGNDIAETVSFLAQSEFITGHIIAVDGGRSLA